MILDIRLINFIYHNSRKYHKNLYFQKPHFSYKTENFSVKNFAYYLNKNANQYPSKYTTHKRH